MEERKLIRLGNSSFAIALPKDWIDKAGLKKGDKVYILPNSNGELMISPEFKKGEDKKISINIQGKDKRRLWREFTGAYINGNFLFEFIGDKTKENRADIKDIIQDYLSCEVIEDNEKNMIVRDFFDFEEADMGRFIKRMDNNIKEMFNLLEKLAENEKPTEKEITEISNIDRDINKFYFLCSRIMTMGLNNPAVLSKLKTDPQELFNNWWLAFHLEHMGDELKATAKKISFAKSKNQEKLLIKQALLEIKEGYDKTLKIFLSGEYKELFNIMEEGRKTTLKCENLIKSKDSNTSLIGEHLKRVGNGSYQILKIMSYFEK